MDCLFCSIVGGAIPAERLFEDEEVIAFRDIHPQAPVHILVLPRKHFASLAHVEETPENTEILGHLLAVVHRIAASQKLDNGYRTVVNTGRDGGQTVDHLHVHLLGGRAMGWPPG